MDTKGSVLRKKLRPRQPERGRSHGALERRADEMFRKSAKNGMALDLLVPSASVEPMSRADAFAQIPEVAAWYLLSDGGEALGFAIMDGTLLDAVIEFETLGRVTSSARGDRPVTRIDGRVGQRLLDLGLNALAGMIADAPELDLKNPFRVLRQEFDRPTLDLILDLPSYTVMKVDLDMGPGGKTGHVQIWLPGAGKPSNRAKADAPRNPLVEDLLPEINTSLETRIKGIRVPLSTIARLSEGTEIKLPADALSRVLLVEPSGKEVLSARLGQLNGARALRVTGPARLRRKTLAPAGEGAMMGGIELGDGSADLALPPVDLGAEPAMEMAPEMPMAIPDELPEIATPEIAMEPMGEADFPAMPEADFPGMTDLPDLPADDELPAMDFAAAPIALD